ncbi:MAG TPA: wax ester/triacylglycerol synthase domain-containing protein, partial [Acidimicrobiales bacterium]|nr:wax ester/triacylglycerol synthase domain-containing protein [Acidimicrobiales bacterium]
MKQLAPGDAFMLYTEQPGSPNHIGSLGIFDPSTAPGGRVTFEELVDYMAKRIHLGKAFRRRLVRVPMDLADPWWVEDANFDMEYHLRHTALPSPGNWQQLCALVGRLHSRPLDLTRPPWESWMIEGLNDIPGVPPGSFGLLVRVHHTAIDGVGGIELLGALLQLQPGDPPPDVPDLWQADRMPSQWELLGRAAVTNATRPVRLAQGAVSVLPKAVRLVGRLRANEIKLPTLSVPATRFNARVSPHRVFDSAVFALDDLRKMKASVPGATVNDAIITITAGALRKYLDD